MTTCGSTSPNGPAAGIPARVDGGSRSATSAPSTPPGPTGGSSVTAPAAPTSTATPGHRSSGTRRFPAGTHPTTLPWPATGPTGCARADPRSWRRPGNDSSAPNTDAVRPADCRGGTPTGPRPPQPVGAVVPHGAQGADPPGSDLRQPPDDPPPGAH